MPTVSMVIVLVSKITTWKYVTLINIYILIVLDETNISGRLHFSMQYIEMSCDPDRASSRINVNVSQ